MEKGRVFEELPQYTVHSTVLQMFRSKFNFLVLVIVLVSSDCFAPSDWLALMSDDHCIKQRPLFRTSVFGKGNVFFIFLTD